MTARCTAHTSPATPAEEERRHERVYIVLRCPECNGRRGLRLKTHEPNLPEQQEEPDAL